MIYVRDDDVLVNSRGWRDPLEKFRRVHQQILRSHEMLHIPTIVVDDLRQMPEAVEYIREETLEGRMRPELHGLQHIDYGALDYQTVCEHLEASLDWMECAIDRRPQVWYTPWGANTERLRMAASSYALRLVDCSDLLKIEHVSRALREGVIDVRWLHGREIFMHWWQVGLRLKRISHAVEAGSWDAAAKAHPELFGR